MTETKNKYVEKTKAWIAQFVVALDLCPFASYPFANGLIEYQVSSHTDFRACMQEQLEAIQRLISTPAEELSNLFVIYSGEVSFEFLLDLEYSLEGLMEEAGIEGAFQTVVFHPDFRFEGEPADAHGNYTNRSPYPMLHLLRADEVATAIAEYGDVDHIPTRNMEILEKTKISSVESIFTPNFEARVKQLMRE